MNNIINKTNTNLTQHSDKKSYKLYATIVVVAIFSAWWWASGFPRSLAEYKFTSKLKTISMSNASEISLTELMLTDWETVCESHGYDDELFLAKYNKKFPTAGQMQDGAWGLIFIKSDGTYDLVSSTCSQGNYLHFSLNRCLTREKSTMYREKTDESNNCVYFQAS